VWRRNPRKRYWASAICWACARLAAHRLDGQLEPFGLSAMQFGS